MTTKRFKLEFVDLPGAEPLWFETREDLDQTVTLLMGCPIDDGPLRLRVTEFGVVRSSLLTHPNPPGKP